jgi:bifunctional ADP-heptose synthase (sugar kinase/adenylyltransferase)
MKILVVGDSCLDTFIYGDIDRIAPEAPVPVIKPKYKKENGGMAANVVANLKSLGAEVDLITNSTLIKKIRFVDERYNQMVLRVDENDFCSRINFKDITFEGETKSLKTTTLNSEYINKNYNAIVISDYCKGFLEEEDIEKLTKFDIPTFLDTKKFLGDYCNDIDFIKINSLEHQKNFERIPNYPNLLNKLIITKGKYGCEYKEKIYPTEEVPVKDVSGAGDTFIAGLVVEYVKSKDIEKAIDFAQECTTKVVQKSGVSTI